ncbi:HAMP domain-containing sensor histidine kinase [Terrilactibacillus sp. S3-3]|nr:HAMP domain-containing sensor histidine kinase [Terrilactibacillus sp. S3-3]
MNIIYEEADKLSGMIKNLFDLAKMDNNTFQIQKQQFPMLPMLEQIKHKLNPVFQNKNITLTINCKNGIQLIADPIRFEQIIINLLDNAYKYSEANTHVYLNLKNEQGTWKLTIKDNGKGIPKDDLHYIFLKNSTALINQEQEHLVERTGPCHCERDR